MYGLKQFGRMRRRRFNKRYPRTGYALKKFGQYTGLQKQVNILKSLINVEKKYVDTNQDQNIDNTWSVIPISLMGEGNDSTQRNGRKVKADSVYLNGQITIDPDATKTTFRCVILIDKGQDGTGVTSADVFQVDNDLQSPLNKQNAGQRFVILYDRFVDLSINGVETKTIRVFRKLNHHVNYLGTGATQSDEGPGNMFMLLLSNEPTEAPLFHYYVRFNYIDN